MKSKEIAVKIMSEAKDIKGDFDSMRDAVQKTIVQVMKKMKGIVGEIPDEDSFLKVVADIGDMAFKAPNPLIEMIDGPAIYFALKQIDRLLLDRFLGKDWYDRLKKLAG